MTASEYLHTATSPAWSEPSTDASTGVDFLGTREVNLEMLGRLTGPYNNTVVSARQHVIMAWAAWRYRENCRANDVDPSSTQFQDFIDMIETIQCVGQHEHGPQYGGSGDGLGSGTLPQPNEDGLIPLRFSSYGRSRTNTSAFAAVQYGPSAKPTSFGLLDSRAGIWGPTERGVALARALDPLLRNSRSYEALTRLPVPETMSRADVVEIASQGLIIGRNLPVRPERSDYVTFLFDLDRDGVALQHSRRLTLTLLLEIVDKLGQPQSSVTPDTIRRHLLAACTVDGVSLELPTYLHRAAGQWQLLQLRQLQRFALECWLFLAEWRMDDAKTAQLIVDQLCTILVPALAPDDDISSLLSQQVEDALLSYRAHRNIDQGLRWAADEDSKSPFSLVSTTQQHLERKQPAEAVPSIVALTLAVVTLSRLMVHDSDPLTFAHIGDRRRVSLAHFRRWWDARAAMPFQDVLVEMLEEFVLQQHVAVAVARFDNERRRLRFSNDEMGWAMLPGTKLSVPRPTPDRIEALLRLMSDLELLDTKERGFSISEQGREVLARVGKKEDGLRSG